ncbi:MAG: aminotransferase class I/II-fold pyridoxal phosphate-dependent enzyme [Streptosporangiales bacterium]|nr:aminotransferase class I/II-fold pyridoxal phosphate-dependent enzyme [Streptosporangiales bacterium]
MDRFMQQGELATLLGDWSGGGGPLYRRLADRLCALTEEGAIPPGTRLPAERSLAVALAVSRSTVVAAYDRLRAAGLAESRQGSGTRISGTLRRPLLDGRVPGGTAGTIFQRMLDGPGRVMSLATACEPGAAEVAEAAQAVVCDDLPLLLRTPGYAPYGLPELRTAIADRLTLEGLPTTPAEVLVTNGAQQGIALAAQLCVRPGDRVLAESPSFAACLDLFRDVGAVLVGAPLDEEGPDPVAVAEVLRERRPTVLYVMPTYHNPTGLLMSAARRRRLAELAAEHGVTIIEDNAFDIRLRDTPPPPPLAAYAPKGAEVLSVGSLGKAAWGGLRIGWVRGPAGLIDRLARRKVLADLSGPLIEQAIATRLLGRLDELLARRGPEARERLERLEKLLGEHLPEWRWRRPDGGAALWVELPGVDAGAYAQVALRHGVEVVPGSTMGPDGEHASFMRLPFVHPLERLDDLVARLAEAWAEMRRHGAVERVSPSCVI